MARGKIQVFISINSCASTARSSASHTSELAPMEGWNSISAVPINSRCARFVCVERKMKALERYGVVDMLDASTLTFFHRVLTIGNDVGHHHKGTVPLYAKILELEKIERTNRELNKAIVSPERVKKVMEFLHVRLRALDKKCELARVKKWLDQPHIPQPLKHLIMEAVIYKTELEETVAEIDENDGKLVNSGDLETSHFLGYYDVFMSPRTFSASVFDVDRVKRIMGSVAKIDRLPSANSLEGLRILQDAWDHVEVYHLAADTYKIISKAVFILLLMAAITVVIYSELTFIWGIDSQLPILVLSFASAGLSTYLSYVNPVTKWQQLRMAALSIESNIWSFRSRAGQYRTINMQEYDHSAEETLAENLKDIKATVLDGADIKNTTFFSRMKSQNKHGQHDSLHPTFGAMDNYRSKPGTESPKKKQAKSQKGAEDQSKGYSELSKLDDLFNDSFHSTLLKRHGKLDDDNSDSKKLNVMNVLDNRSSLRDGSSPGRDSGDFTHDNPMGSPSRYAKVPTDGERQFDGNDDDADDVELRITINDHLMVKDSEGISLSDALYWLTLQDDDPESQQNATNTHYEPVHPDNYIRYRLLPATDFYRSKIPICNRTKNLAQVLMVLGSFAGVIMAMIDMPSWTAVIGITTASISAYLEFLGTNSKLTRYSATVHALQELVFWWQTLPQIDRAGVANIDHLIITCEEIIQRENQAWQSSSQAAKLLKKQAGGSDSSSSSSENQK